MFHFLLSLNNDTGAIKEFAQMYSILSQLHKNKPVGSRIWYMSIVIDSRTTDCPINLILLFQNLHIWE